MLLNVDPQAKAFLIQKQHYVLTISAEQECVGCNCSEFFVPVIRYEAPKTEQKESFERFDLDGIVVYFEKTLEPERDVTLKLKHEMFTNHIEIEGIEAPPIVTHHKF